VGSILTRLTKKKNLKSTKARKEFKEKFGQANHLLITTLVGLDAIEKKIVQEKPKSFSTSWNPKDPISSARRARIFVLKAFLGSAVEALEMYLTELNRKPKLLQDHKDDRFLRIYSNAGQSIYKKVIKVGEEIKVDPIIIGLIEILITWRNYTLHYDIDNELRPETWKTLVENAETIKIDFNGLDVLRLKETWEKNKDFTFKETASIINACQIFVQKVDSFIVSELDVEQYVLECLERHFENIIYFQRFKSSRNKEEYLISTIEKNIGFKNFVITSKILNHIKNCR
jgi:hypothetical protein